MAKNNYGFDDIVEAQQGIFGRDAATIAGDSAMDNYQRPKLELTQDGLKIGLTCEGCGMDRHIIAEYAELISLKYGVPPQNSLPPLIQQGHRLVESLAQWGYDPEQQMWHPNIPCPGGCRWPLRPLITPGEINGSIKNALEKGFLAKDFHDRLANTIVQMKQRG